MALNDSFANRNPFDVTKAADYTDEQILDTWVDFPKEGGFMRMVDPTSPMPRILLGGKGSGRTHLLRWLSYPIRKLQSPNALISKVQNDKYLGIYLRCSGLNSSRFARKGVEDDTWNSVFQYYLELWLAQIALSTLNDLLLTDPSAHTYIEPLSIAIVSLLNDDSSPQTKTLKEAQRYFNSLQLQLDTSINNAAIKRNVDDISIRTTPGRLVFGIPKLVNEYSEVLRDVQFLYLIDEFENFTEPQQRYVNTLLREREWPCSFFVGSRDYGIKTYETLSSGESNREGSEFEALHLDEVFQTDFDGYYEFASRVVMRRLSRMGLALDEEAGSRGMLEGFFQNVDSLEQDAVRLERGLKNKPYFAVLSSHLTKYRSTRLPMSEREVAQLIDALSFPSSALIEKANCFLLYRAWSRKQNLLKAADEIAISANAYVSDPDVSKLHPTVLDYFKRDLVAQLYRDAQQKQRYSGFAEFVTMSSGILRNLLMILKDIYRWAEFNGERPFSEDKITFTSQRLGVQDASEWFFRDAYPLGEEGERARNVVARLANLFRSLRFSEKPPEASLCTFSVDLTACSNEVRSILRTASSWSLLVQARAGERNRNSDQVDAKYYLNPMLCPQWDLSVYRRGTIALSSSEMQAICTVDDSNAAYGLVVRNRMARVEPPFRAGDATDIQELLPGFDRG